MTTWQELFAELRRVYGDVSDLLLDSQRLLGHAGWSIAHGKDRQIGIERAGAIDVPDLWAPQWIGRFFHFEGAAAPKGPVIYVACVLSDGGQMDFKLPAGSPVVTFGVIRFKPDAGKNWDWWYWIAKSWLWTKGPENGREWRDFDRDRFEKAGIARVECAAVALEEVKDRATLERLVIEPLLSKAGMSRLPETGPDAAP